MWEPKMAGDHAVGFQSVRVQLCGTRWRRIFRHGSVFWADAQQFLIRMKYA